MTDTESRTIYGTLNLLILKTVETTSLHGLGIQRRIHVLAGEELQIEEGALYPALHRLERDGLLQASWGISDKNRRAKFYELTPKGRRRLENEMKGWLQHTRAVSRVLHVAPEEGA